MKIKIALLFAGLAIIGIVYIALRPHYPEIRVSNNSIFPITNVILSGSGFSQHISSIPPNTSITRKVIPRGESGLAIEFEVNFKKIQKTDLAYLEAAGGYNAHIEINRNLEISCDSSLETYN